MSIHSFACCVSVYQNTLIMINDVLTCAYIVFADGGAHIDPSSKCI